MTKSQPPSPLPAPDYDAIESAMMETERGRWFLKEYARRNRNSDTSILLDAIGKLETTIKTPAPDSSVDKIRMDLMEMSKAIAHTRSQIAAMKPESGEGTQFLEATEELDAIIRTAEKATNDILEAAEEIQETAWVMREQGADTDACDRLDVRATDIYSACSFQDLTGQRTAKVIDVLRFLEERVSDMMDIWGDNELEFRQIPKRQEKPDAHLLNGPQQDGLNQDDIDTMITASSGTDAAETLFAPQAQTFAEQAAPVEPAHVPQTLHAEEIPDMPEESQAMLDELARSQEDPILQNPVPAADPFARMDTNDDPLFDDDDATSSSQKAPEETPKKSDPDDLLASGDTGAPPNRNGGPTLKASAKHSDPDVLYADDFSEPEPLTLSSLSDNSRTVLFC